ncbi:MAG TPA: hypothetical protein VGQ59_21495, partial [Cyclobacteriaceae bacterium]|nr:hypothetical protein [Cyclobacteriaceae bacterium]
NEYIKFTDNKREIKLNWDAFQSYSIKDNVIFLNQSDNFDHSYMLGKDDFAEDIYVELKTFLIDKSSLKYREV